MGARGPANRSAASNGRCNRSIEREGGRSASPRGDLTVEAGIGPSMLSISITTGLTAAFSIAPGDSCRITRYKLSRVRATSLQHLHQATSSFIASRVSMLLSSLPRPSLCLLRCAHRSHLLLALRILPGRFVACRRRRRGATVHAASRRSRCGCGSSHAAQRSIARRCSAMSGVSGAIGL